MSVNDDLYNRSIDHAGMSRLTEETVQTDANRIVRNHIKRVKKGLFGRNPTAKSTMEEVLKPENKRFIKELDGSLSGHMKEIAIVESDFHTNNLNKSLGKFANIKRTPTNKILEEIVGANIQGKDSLSAHVSNLGKSELVRMDQAIKQGVANGSTQKQIIKDVVGKTKLTQAQATALVRTGITRTQSVAQINSFKGNEDLLKGVRFTATLDAKTSQICAHHDGEIYDINDQRFVPPLHWRCRSTLIPVVKSHSDLLETQSPQLKKKVLKNMAANKIALLNGVGPKKESYGDWLKKQPQSTVLRHLEGDTTKVELFNNGNLPLQSFTNSKGKALSITALRRLDNAATTVVPTKTTVISEATRKAAQVNIGNPRTLMRNTSKENELKKFFINEANDNRSALGLVDYRGTSIAGKRVSRRRANNEFDERNQSIDPLTGEMKSTLIYSPDHNVLQERIDFLNNSKLLSVEEKRFIERFALSLENQGVSVNQQTVIVENLRILFERFAKDKRPWDNYVALTRAEMVNSVVNSSRIIDRRSRASSQQFKFGADSPSIQILGEYTSFDDIAARTLTNQRYVKNWANTEGIKLARIMYAQGRSPLRDYFPQVPAFLPKLPKVRENIYKQIEKLPGGKRLVRKLEGKPNDALLTEFLQKGKEALRGLLDLEFLYAKKRNAYTKKSLLPNFIKKKHKELAEISKDIATGKSTDYDTLSINIGKRLYENNKNDFDVFLPKPSIAEFHKMLFFEY